MALSSSLEQARVQLQQCLRQGAEAQGRPVQLEDGQVLFEANATSDGLFVLERGELIAIFELRVQHLVVRVPLVLCSALPVLVRLLHYELFAHDLLHGRRLILRLLIG